MPSTVASACRLSSCRTTGMNLLILGSTTARVSVVLAYALKCALSAGECHERLRRTPLSQNPLLDVAKMGKFSVGNDRRCALPRVGQVEQHSRRLQRLRLRFCSIASEVCRRSAHVDWMRDLSASRTLALLAEERLAAGQPGRKDKHPLQVPRHGHEAPLGAHFVSRRPYARA